MNRELWRKGENLFHAALERAPEERQSFLDSACNGDAALRQMELRFHAFRSKPNILRQEGGCKIAALDELKKSLLHRAFNGGL